VSDLLRGFPHGFSVELSAEGTPMVIRRDGSSSPVGGGQMSSGEAEVLGILFDLAMICSIWAVDRLSGVLPPHATNLLLIDEPDTHLHPDLQQDLARALVLLQERYGVQLLVATHSTTLLAALGRHGGERTSVVYLDNQHEVQTAARFDEVLLELTTCLGGHLLMGPLFGAPILLVEGADDYEIWSHVPRGKNPRISVIPCNGEEIFRYRRLLSQLFGSLRRPGSGPAGFALLDGDKGEEGASAGDAGDVVPILRLNCHESENLYLTAEVLKEMGWPSPDAAIAHLHASAEGLPIEVQRTLAGLTASNRSKADIKLAIKHIVDILDSTHRVPWATRVGKSISSVGPTGELREFLGERVVRAIWGS
jgi:hypothetical protein